MQQLTDILFSYVRDGSSKAATVVRNKYDQLKERLTKQKDFPYRYCEREQFEELMVASINIGKWKSFKRCVDDAGSIIQARKDDKCSYYDWFLHSAEIQFGKNQVWGYLNDASTTSQNVCSVVSGYQKVELSRKNHQADCPPITFEFLIEEIQKHLLDQRPYGIIGHCMRFAREASKEELEKLAKYIEAEDFANVFKADAWIKEHFIPSNSGESFFFILSILMMMPLLLYCEAEHTFDIIY